MSETFEDKFKKVAELGIKIYIQNDEIIKLMERSADLQREFSGVYNSILQGLAEMKEIERRYKLSKDAEQPTKRTPKTKWFGEKEE
jgi:hypothetical protein